MVSRIELECYKGKQNTMDRACAANGRRKSGKDYVVGTVQRQKLLDQDLGEWMKRNWGELMEKCRHGMQGKGGGAGQNSTNGLKRWTTN